jgi:outer membrane lipoprotein carrier protein
LDFVTTLRALLGGFLLVFATPAQVDLQKLLTAVENRYNRPRTMSFTFHQTYSGGGRITRNEHGQLFLQKPGKMRWQYEEPPGKLFLTDGRYAYFYSPATRRVEKMRLKETDDMRAPLAFLMGRLDFRRDFREFRTYPEGRNVYIVATPKSEKAPYTQVAFVVNPQYQIEMLRVNGQDESILVYRLTDEKLNVPVSESMFVFQPPPGVEVVEEANP